MAFLSHLHNPDADFEQYAPETKYTGSDYLIGADRAEARETSWRDGDREVKYDDFSYSYNQPEYDY